MTKRYTTPARRMGTETYRLAMRKLGDFAEIREGIPATMSMDVRQAYIDYGGPRTNYRPRLVLQGHAAGFAGEFPGGIEGVRASDREDRDWIDYYYEFTRENLAELCAKGLHEDGFQVPRVISRNTLDLPCLVDMAVIKAPREHGEKRDPPPIAFVRVQDGSKPGEPNTLTCCDVPCEADGRDIPGSGYDISSYFERMPDGGYAMKASAEALDDLDDLMDQASRPEARPDEPEADLTDDDAVEAGEAKDLADEGRAAEGPEPGPDAAESADEAHIADPELRELYWSAKDEALAALEAARNARRDLGTARAADEIAHPEDYADAPEPDIGADEETLVGGGEPEPDAGDAARADLTRRVNRAENVDSPEEWIEEREDLGAQAEAYVEKGDVAGAGRALPDTSRIDANRDVPDLFDAPDI